jgi:DNA-binding response OmpR family regulator
VVAAALDLGHRRRLAGSRALLVDDDQTFLAALRPVLEASGLRVSTADGPVGFWQRLEDVGPDIIVLDFEMPGVSGAELCRALRNEPRWASVPVMFMTSRTDAETVGAIFEAGADDYVTKPFTGEEVVARIKNRLDRAGLHAATAEADLPSGIVESPAPLPATDIESENGTVVQHVDVVVIEDDVVLARLLVHALETRGYRTRLISDGEIAAAELAGAAPTLGAPLLLLDWDLPGLDGLRLLRTLRERGVLDRSRVIMLTARGTEAEVLQALQAGAADHVTKPFSVPVLMRRVHNALER